MKVILLILFSSIYALSQKSITIDIYSHTNDYLTGNHNYKNAVGVIKKITSDFIQLSEVKDAEGKRIKRGKNSWAFVYNDSFYVNLSSFPIKRETSNKFVKVNYVTNNVLILFPSNDSELFRLDKMPIAFNYGGGIIGAAVTQTNIQRPECYWESEALGAYQINFLPLYKLRSKELKRYHRGEFKLFGKPHYNMIREENGENKLSPKEVNNLFYEDVQLFLKDYFENK